MYKDRQINGACGINWANGRFKWVNGVFRYALLYYRINLCLYCRGFSS
jgi:hypothetical protein